MSLERQIVGVDCAMHPKKVGPAFATVKNGKCSLREVRLGKSNEQVLDVMAAWLKHGVPTLLAMDAPLGWPVAILAFLMIAFRSS